MIYSVKYKDSNYETARYIRYDGNADNLVSNIKDFISRDYHSVCNFDIFDYYDINVTINEDSTKLTITDNFKEELMLEYTLKEGDVLIPFDADFDCELSEGDSLDFKASESMTYEQYLAKYPLDKFKHETCYESGIHGRWDDYDQYFCCE